MLKKRKKSDTIQPQATQENQTDPVEKLSKASKFFANPNVEKAINIGMPVLISFIVGFAMYLSTLEAPSSLEVIFATLLWTLSLILTIITIILVIICGHYQKKVSDDRLQQAKDEKEKALKKANEINEHYIKLGILLNNFLTSEIYYYNKYELVENKDLIKNNGRYWIEFEKIESFRSHWDTICDKLCSLVDILREKGDDKGKQFGANIVIMCQKDGKPAYYMPSDAYTHMPNSRSVLQNDVAYTDGFDDKHKRHYHDLLSKNFSRVEIKLGRDEINEAFHIRDGEKFEYNQYIAIPLRYKNITFGILQIIAYEKSFLVYEADKEAARETLKDYVNTYFSIYEKLVLLTFILSLKSVDAAGLAALLPSDTEDVKKAG